jgi:hypothetical protein
MVQPDSAGVIPSAPVSCHGVARPAALSGLAGTTMSQFTLAAAAGGVVDADAEGVGVVQALGLAEAVTVVEGVGAAVEVVVSEALGIAVAGGVGVMVRGGGRCRQRRPGSWAAVTAALVVAETAGAAESLGVAEAESAAAGVVVPGVADDETQAVPLAASLVVASFAPEWDEISIPATTPSTATSVPAITPRRARGRSSNTW